MNFFCGFSDIIVSKFILYIESFFVLLLLFGYCIGQQVFFAVDTEGIKPPVESVCVPNPKESYRSAGV